VIPPFITTSHSALGPLPVGIDAGSEAASVDVPDVNSSDINASDVGDDIVTP
jgi:hypothetical protein